MHRLDHHYGIVHHYGDGKHEGGQRKEVEREAEDVEEEECSHQRHRHGNQRDERRAHVLKEDIYHDEHEDERLEKCFDKLVDRSVKELCDVLHDLELHSRRQRFLRLGQHLLDIGGNLGSVTSGGLRHHHHTCCLTVNRLLERIVKTTQLNVGHVLDTYGATVCVTRDNHVLELFGSLQTAFISYGILILIVRLLAELTGSSLYVLLSQHSGDITRHEVVVLHLHRVEPETHRIRLQSHGLTLTHTLYTLDGRDDVDVGIVAEELVVVLLRITGDGEYEHGTALTLHHLHTGTRHLGRQQGRSL